MPADGSSPYLSLKTRTADNPYTEQHLLTILNMNHVDQLGLIFFISYGHVIWKYLCQLR